MFCTKLIRQSSAFAAECKMGPSGMFQLRMSTSKLTQLTVLDMYGEFSLSLSVCVFL